MTIEETIQLRCYIRSASMCALLVHAAKKCASTVTIARGGNVVEIKKIMDLMLEADGPPGKTGLPSPTVKITVSGPDAYSAIGNTLLTVAAPGVLANDSDPDGDTLALTGFFPTSANGGTASTPPVVSSGWRFDSEALTRNTSP